MKKRNIIITIILSLITVVSVIFGYFHINKEVSPNLEIETNRDYMQCLYGCPSTKKKKKTKATRFKRKYIQIR